MSGEVAIRERQHIRPPVGLLLSIGDPPTDERNYPQKRDSFRFKDGALGQFTREAEKARDVYGNEPTILDDVLFLSNNIAEVLDIRLLAFGKSGIKGVGDTNYALLNEDEFLARVFSYQDDFTYFPRQISEVRPELRENWMGEPVRGAIEGPDDKRVDKLGIAVRATLSFCLPKVMGIGKVAQITTTSRRSIRNFYQCVHAQHEFFAGRLVGIPFRLEMRPARTNYFDKEARQWKQTTFHELVLDTPFTLQDVLDRIRQRREALGGEADVLGLPDRVERDVFADTLGLPSGVEDEEVQLREEPEPAGDARLNRLARLEEEAREAGEHPESLLRGVFGVDSAAELGEEDAARYEEFLLRVVPSEEVTDAEIVDAPLSEGDEREPGLAPGSHARESSSSRSPSESDESDFQKIAKRARKT